jgi:very-short-patch-repair endonuclease
MTTYRRWLESFANHYVDLLKDTEIPFGLFLYDTPHTSIATLLKPLVPLLIERELTIELISWDEILDLLEAAELFDEEGHEISFRGKDEAMQASIDAWDKLRQLIKTPNLLVVDNLEPPPDERAAFWLYEAVNYRLRLIEGVIGPAKLVNNKLCRVMRVTGPSISNLIWLLSPLTWDEWVEVYDHNLPDIYSALSYRLWWSCVFNGPPLPSKILSDEGKATGISWLMGESRLPPFPEVSPIQRILRDVLDLADLEYHMEYPVPPYRLDFAIVGEKVKLDIECDGQEYHTSPEQVEHDRRRNNALTEQGWIVLRYSGSQIYNNPYGCVGQVLRTLSTHGASVSEYDADESGAFIPPVTGNNAQDLRYIVERRVAEKRRKRREGQLAEEEAERQAILNNPEYIRRRELVEEMLRELSRTLSFPRGD